MLIPPLANIYFRCLPFTAMADKENVMAQPQGPPDTEKLEEPQKTRTYMQGFGHVIVTFTSAIFAFLYLMVLLIGAQMTAIWAPRTKKDPNVKLTKAQRALHRNLKYYIELAGFELEFHDVWSPDSYQLDVTRILGRKEAIEDEKAAGSKQRYPILLLPGLMQHVGAYCSAGPDAMALVLHRAGYDVWLGNTRSSIKVHNRNYSEMSHKTWRWSIEDMALTDVPTIIEHVKKETGADKIAVVGHSQGTTQTFMCLSKHGRPDVGHSISTFCALAPAVFAGPAIDRWFLKLVRRHRWAYRSMMGDRAFLGIMGALRSITPLKLYTHAAYNMFYYMLSWSDKLWDRHYRNRSFIFTPSVVSSSLMFWWLGKGGFADTGCIFKNPEKNESWFDERFPNVGLFTCGLDNLCDPKPLKKRMATVEKHVPYTIFDYPDYSHMDVMWAKDVPERVTVPLGEFVWKNVDDKDLWREPVWPTAGSRSAEAAIDPATHEPDYEVVP